MLLRLFARLVWGTTKFTVKHVVVPIAISAAVAAALSMAADKLREGSPEADGRVEPTIKPEP